MREAQHKSGGGGVLDATDRQAAFQTNALEKTYLRRKEIGVSWL